jgi:hypothetical protein
VNLDDPHLRERYDPFDGVGDQVLADLRLLLDSDSPQRVRPPSLRMLQEMAGAGDTSRAMNERQRPAGDVRHHALGDTFVVLSEVDL